MTDLTESPDWALGCMTAILGDMRHDLGIARHMIHSDAAMDMEWARWTDHLDEEHEALTEHHQTICAAWRAQEERHTTELATLRAELEAVKEKKAAPGSKEDLATAASMWRMLGAMGDVLTKGVASTRGRPTKVAPRSKRA